MSDSTEQQDVRGRGTADTRKERIPFGVQQSRLTVPEHRKDPGYVYRWVNDDGRGRIQSAIDGGYEFAPAESDMKVGTGSVDGNSDVGSKVSRVVGTQEGGSGMRAYLMRIPREFYDADQRAKQAEIDKFDAAIKRGDTHKSGDDNRYNAGISVNTVSQRVKVS